MRVALLVAAVLAVAPARASTVMRLGPAALEQGADRIVDARVTARTVAWNAAHTGLETRAVLAVEVTHKGAPRATVEVVVPGGELAGARHIVVGMPAIAVGERARWFLRDRGDGSYRVYGWAQGKWPAQLVAGKPRYAPAPLAAERDGSVVSFTTNGMVWPAERMPVPYLVQNSGSADLALGDEIAAIDAAFATWQAVPQATLGFRNVGMTDLPFAVDGTNVIGFIESGWVFGTEAAAATSLFILPDQQTADIAMNGENFRWAIAPPGSGITSNVLDLQAVLTHEIGHFSGLNHTERAFDTMYFSWGPWQGQRSLSIDDKLGLASIYPIAGHECLGDGPSTCPATERCALHPLGRLCEGSPDPIGAPCNFNRVECDGFCLFTAVNLSTGYCSRFCATDHDCPLTHHCADAQAGSDTVKVCFSGAQPLCSTCPAGQHCDAATNSCTFECRAAEDCGPTASCDGDGFCVAGPPPGDGGGCRTGGGPPGALIALAALGLLVTCRRSS